MIRLRDRTATGAPSSVADGTAAAGTLHRGEAVLPGESEAGRARAVSNAGRDRVIGAVAIAAALTPLNSTMVAVALPALSAEFAVAASSVTAWVVTGYLVATIACQMPAGRVADGVGYARALTLGRWIFAGGTIAALAAPTLALVVVGRFLMAAGGALMIPTAMALLRITVPPERRPRAFGAMGAVMAGAAAAGPALGGLLAGRFGWRALFLVNVPLLVVSALLQPRGLSEVQPAGQVGRGTGWGLELLRIRGFAAGACVIALQNLGMYALIVQIPFLFAALSRASAPQIGVALTLMAATMAVTSPLGGWISEWAGVRATVFAGGLLGAVGIASLTRIGPSFALADVAGRLLLVGLGLGLSTGPSQAAALTAVDHRQSGTASAMISMLRYLGGIAGTTILSVALGPHADSLARHHAALWIFVGAFGASCVCATLLTPIRPARCRPALAYDS